MTGIPPGMALDAVEEVAMGNLPIPADSQPGVEPTELLTPGIAIASFGESVDGELYIVGYGGRLYEVVATP